MWSEGPQRIFFRGVLHSTKNSAHLIAGGVSIEVLTASAVPSTDAKLKQARASTIAALGGPVTKVVQLMGTQEEGYILNAVLSGGESSASLAVKKPAVDFSKIVRAINKNRAMLESIPGVISVRPGFLFKNGWITKTPAIVVTVAPSRGLAAAKVDRARIPAEMPGNSGRCDNRDTCRAGAFCIDKIRGAVRAGDCLRPD